MGQSLPCHRILLLGMPNTGKTRFTNLLQFGSDMTYLGHTHGKIESKYKHKHTMFSFTEMGGTIRHQWEACLETCPQVYHAIYFFFEYDQSVSDLQSAFQYLLNLYAKNHVSHSLPLACVVYHEGVSSHHLNPYMCRLQKALQLNHLSQPVLLTDFCVDDDGARLSNFIHQLLDWTRDKIKTNKG